MGPGYAIHIYLFYVHAGRSMRPHVLRFANIMAVMDLGDDDE